MMQTPLKLPNTIDLNAPIMKPLYYNFIGFEDMVPFSTMSTFPFNDCVNRLIQNMLNSSQLNKNTFCLNFDLKTLLLITNESREVDEDHYELHYIDSLYMHEPTSGEEDPFVYIE